MTVRAQTLQPVYWNVVNTALHWENTRKTLYKCSPFTLYFNLTDVWTHHDTHFALLNSNCDRVSIMATSSLLLVLRTAHNQRPFISAHHVDVPLSLWYLELWPFPFPATYILSACLYYHTPPLILPAHMHVVLLLEGPCGLIGGSDAPCISQGLPLSWVFSRSSVGILHVILFPFHFSAQT